MNDNEILFINIMHYSYHQIIVKIYLPNQNNIELNEKYVVIKRLFWIYFQINQSFFEWQVSLLFFINEKKLSSHMDQISEPINSSNHNILYHDHMVKIIVNLSNNKCGNNNNSTVHINNIHK